MPTMTRYVALGDKVKPNHSNQNPAENDARKSARGDLGKSYVVYEVVYTPQLTITATLDVDEVVEE